MKILLDLPLNYPLGWAILFHVFKIIIWKKRKIYT